MRLATQRRLIEMYVWHHQINGRRRLRALAEYVAWQVGSRLVPGPVVVPFAGRAKILGAPYMDGALPHIWCGLGEFEDMGFMLHYLRPDELFADVGANVGPYTMLAAAEVGARCVAFEPGRDAFETLRRNAALNDCLELIETRRAAIGRTPGEISMTVGLDTLNHVVDGAPPDGVEVEQVPVETIDQVFAGRPPRLIKLDVEGFEIEALAGAAATLADPGLGAFIAEVDGYGSRYGDSDAAVCRTLFEAGLQPVTYEPLARRLLPRDLAKPRPGPNVLFVRDLAEAQRLVADAPAVDIKGIPV